MRCGEQHHKLVAYLHHQVWYHSDNSAPPQHLLLRLRLRLRLQLRLGLKLRLRLRLNLQLRRVRRLARRPAARAAKMTASPLPAPSSGAKPSLKPLTHALSVLTPANYVLALKSAALHLQGRDADIDDSVVHAQLSHACKLAGANSSVKQLLQSCCVLLKQVGRGGGMPREKMQSSLLPLGFRSTHVQMLDDVLQWVRDGAVVPSPDEQEEQDENGGHMEEEQKEFDTQADPEEDSKENELQPEEHEPDVQDGLEESQEPPSELHQPEEKDEKEPSARQLFLAQLQQKGLRQDDSENPRPEADPLSPRSEESALAAKYLGRLSQVAADAAAAKAPPAEDSAESSAEVEVMAMDSAAKAQKVSTLPPGQWGRMTWQQRLGFLQSCYTVEAATAAAKRKRALNARIARERRISSLGLTAQQPRGSGPLEAFKVVSPFNGEVLEPPAWREDEDLSLDVDDIVVKVGPAPYGKRGWSVGYKLGKPETYKIFPSSKQYVRRLLPADIQTLTDEEVIRLSAADSEAKDPVAGYTAVPRVSVESVEVTGVVRGPAAPAPGSEDESVTYYSIQCIGPNGESWTVRRRYTEFEELRADLLRAAEAAEETPKGAAESRGFGHEKLAALSFPAKHSAAMGRRLRAARVVGFDRWLGAVHGSTAGAGRTSHTYILLRRFLRPAGPLPESFSWGETEPTFLGETELAKLSKRQLRQHATTMGVGVMALQHAQAGPTPRATTTALILAAPRCKVPAATLTVYPDTDARGTAEFVTMKLNTPELSTTMAAELRKFMTAKGKLRLEVDLIAEGLGRQFVFILPGEPPSAAVARFAKKLQEELDYELSEAAAKEIEESVRLRVQRE